MLKGFKKGFGFGIGWLLGQSLFVIGLDEAVKVLKTKVEKDKPEETKEEPETTEE